MKERGFQFKLHPGEILAGKVDKPLTALELRGGAKPEQAQYVLRITGDGYQQMQMTNKGGGFELYVPKATYSVCPHQPRAAAS